MVQRYMKMKTKNSFSEERYTANSYLFIFNKVSRWAAAIPPIPNAGNDGHNPDRKNAE